MRGIYANHELDMEAIVHALRIWRHYILGKKFELRIDHTNMKYSF